MQTWFDFEQNVIEAAVCRECNISFCRTVVCLAYRTELNTSDLETENRFLTSQNWKSVFGQTHQVLRCLIEAVALDVNRLY